jgi:hypothetical protein
MKVRSAYPYFCVQSTGIFKPVHFDAFEFLIPHLARPPPAGTTISQRPTAKRKGPPDVEPDGPDGK